MEKKTDSGKVADRGGPKSIGSSIPRGRGFGFKPTVYFDDVDSGGREKLDDVRTLKLYTSPLQLLKAVDVSEARLYTVADVLRRYMTQLGYVVELIRPLIRSSLTNE